MWKLEGGVGKWEFFDDVALPESGGAIGQPNNHYAGDRMFPAGEYDRIFDVEADDGITRKLPFNYGDNIDDAAAKFCLKEGF